MNLKIADMSAKDVMLEIDDAEFLDWCTNNSYARLWHCSQLNKSAILQLAIKNTIQRSPHPDLVNIFDDFYNIQLQFVRFVTAQIEHNVVTGLHIHSLALYYTHGGDSKTKKFDLCNNIQNPHSVDDAGSRLSIGAAFAT